MSRPGRRAAALGVLALLAGALAAGCGGERSEPARRTSAEPRGPGYVGAAACGACHPEETGRWRGSNHDRAMEIASEETVEGDFSDAELVADAERFRFERDGERFVIRTAGADGAESAFEVVYTFGVEPLQQYLVRGPRGRLQAVAAAWDARPAAEGGQRWFHLHGDDPPAPGDPLHWTGMAGRWNAMCAECHSTGVTKGYDLEADAYDTRYEEIDVACEACHGPGADHVAWAEADPPPGSDPGVLLPGVARRWAFASPQDAIAQRVPPAEGDAEVEACAPCHARRSPLTAETAPGRPFLDGFRPALLEEGLYYADGQILDEVYVWGSFVQSRMYAAGVVCSDCHDPHALGIEAPDAACAKCHRSEAFATPAHHGHPPDSPGASCVACHMPARTYMGVDDRRDHSFRVPRPDLSASTGAPDACDDCHGDRPAGWATEAVARWRGGAPTRPHCGEALAAGRRGARGADARLAALAADEDAPAIARATALELLARRPGPGLADGLAARLADPAPLVRMAAAGAAEALPPAARLAALAPRLEDPLRAVRVEAARALAALPAADERPTALAAALAEYRAAQAANADRASAHVNLGLLHEAAGEPAAARAEYETGIRVEPFFVPSYANLADLYRREGDEAACERVLRAGLEAVPEAAALHHALGLAQVRTGKTDLALDSLGRAYALEPEVTRYAYVYALALRYAGESAYALSILEAAHERSPGDADVLLALATLSRERGETARARGWAERLLALRPDDPGAARLLRELQAGGS